MSRRHLIHAALALTLSAGLAATSDAARAQGHREGHERNRHDDRQRDGQSAKHRDHQSRSQQNGGAGRWSDDSRGERTAAGSRQGRQYDSRRADPRRSYDSNSSYGGHGGHGYDSHGDDRHSGHGNNGYGRHGYGGHGYNTYGYNAYGYGVGYVPTYSYLYGGVYYNTNEYGATLLRNSVNYGYQQGLALAYQARAANWGYDYYRTCDAYRVASYGYQPGYIDPLQYSYYYRVGFERGYREGFYAAPPVYAGAYRPGPVDLVVGVLDVILNLQHVGHHGHH